MERMAKIRALHNGAVAPAPLSDNQSSSGAAMNNTGFTNVGEHGITTQARGHLERVVRRVHEFAYNIGDRIIVKEIQRPGLIEAIMLDSMGETYRVCYWADSIRKTEWLYEWELELRHTSA